MNRSIFKYRLFFIATFFAIFISQGGHAAKASFNFLDTYGIADATYASQSAVVKENYFDILKHKTENEWDRNKWLCIENEVEEDEDELQSHSKSYKSTFRTFLLIDWVCPTNSVMDKIHAFGFTYYADTISPFSGVPAYLTNRVIRI